MSFTNGWWEHARCVPSPNFNDRPSGRDPSLLVIHNISLPPGEFGGNQVERFFLNKLDKAEHPFFSEIEGVTVSAHFFIRRTGEVIQFVSVDQRAWHAGVSEFQGEENCNDFSLGVEMEGTDESPYETLQYQALVGLTKDLMVEYPDIISNRITGHSDIAPGRKTDPGPAFDWTRYLSSLNEPE